MMRFLLTGLICCSFLFSYCQSTKQATKPKFPKLVIGLVVDQMRWDFLYKYSKRYGKGGFNRLLQNGFSYENTFIPYAPTVTAAGHSCIYTGSVPAITGIMGNAWYNKTIGRMVYCVEDTSVQSIGTESKNGKMSPANLLTTTITDELKLSNNHQSKVVGICIKDRGSILPAGHTANECYWYDGKTGNWITSSFYAKQLPNWVKQFNEEKWPDKYYAKEWHTLYTPTSYTLSSDDEKPYEGKFKNRSNTSFPHLLSQYIEKDYDVLPGTPYGNSFTLEMAKAAIQNCNLGKNTVPDFLAISLSSPDYIGHRFGPNSIEIEDTYLRLDKDIESFLAYLDKTIGPNQYTLFLSADHGVAHVPGYLKEYKIPSGSWDNDFMVKKLNENLLQQFKVDRLILAESNYQLYINDEAIQLNKLDKKEIIQFIVQYCTQQPGIAQVFELSKIQSAAVPEPIQTMLINGYHKKRAGDVQIILEPAWIDGGNIGTTHGLWNPYDSHIPMVWFGWGIQSGKNYTRRFMTDIAPTLASLLQIQMPNGCVGNTMTEALKN